LTLEFLIKYIPKFVEAAGLTVILSFFAVIGGTILGSMLTFMRISNSRILKAISTIYVEFIRGTPILVQLFIIYFSIDLPLSKFVVAIIALGLNSAAYVSEIIRAGINAVPKGQMEAARSLGMNYKLAMQKIVFPQAIKNILPALANEFVVVIKESSIAYTIGLMELTYVANSARSNSAMAFLPLLVSALFYFLLTFSLTRFIAVAERRMKVSD
jgi:polar amino acid transport system permease protein